MRVRSVGWDHLLCPLNKRIEAWNQMQREMLRLWGESMPDLENVSNIVSAWYHSSTTEQKSLRDALDISVLLAAPNFSESPWKCCRGFPTKSICSLAQICHFYSCKELFDYCTSIGYPYVLGEIWRTLGAAFRVVTQARVGLSILRSVHTMPFLSPSKPFGRK
jgi:hypothetical protein